MGLDCREAGRRLTLIHRWKKLLASTAVAAAIGVGAAMYMPAPALSGGETRTVALYQVHTGESLTVTYMKNGKYIPSAMKKINYLLRDWRRTETITISPRTIDLMWELHADLGSKKPIHIVSGYRSPKTNAFLKKIGRNVARKSQHMLGKAIDLYFPDISTEKMRNSALVRKVGGVGYYRSGGGPTGFLHIDSGNVRHWGPAISSSQMARIMRDYRKTVGARLGKGGKGFKPVPDTEETLVADASASGLPSQQDGGANAKVKNRKKIPLENAYTEDDEELAGMSQDASAPPQKPKAKPGLPPQPQLTADAGDDEQEGEAQQDVSQRPQQVAQAVSVPKPRPKPIEVLMMAAVNMKIEPASAPPPTQVERTKPGIADNNTIGVVVAAETMDEPSTDESSKTSLAEELNSGSAKDVPMLKPMVASAAGPDSGNLFWWPSQLVLDTERSDRENGAPQDFAQSLVTLLPGIADDANAETAPQLPRLAVASMQATPLATASGKSDMLVVNREGKGSLLSPPALKKLKLGLLEDN
jgi:uncharacterized protein YcbK (DUF882 family)